MNNVYNDKSCMKLEHTFDFGTAMIPLLLIHLAITDRLTTHTLVTTMAPPSLNFSGCLPLLNYFVFACFAINIIQ